MLVDWGAPDNAPELQNEPFDPFDNYISKLSTSRGLGEMATPDHVHNRAPFQSPLQKTSSENPFHSQATAHPFDSQATDSFDSQATDPFDSQATDPFGAFFSGNPPPTDTVTGIAVSNNSNSNNVEFLRRSFKDSCI